MIVDAHHHVWRRADLPWLLGPTVPRIFGDYGPLKRDYPMAEFLDDVAGTGVARSVVTCRHGAELALRRGGWVCRGHTAEIGLASKSDAISAFCDMRQATRRRDLARPAAFPLCLRAIRPIQMHHLREPALKPASPPADDTAVAEVGRSPNVRPDLRRLRASSSSCRSSAHQADAALRLVDACPGVIFVLQHAAMPEDPSEPGMRRWRQALEALASRRSVHAKLSGIGTFLRRNDPPLISRVLDETVSAFGADRCLFGSNFPIEKMWTSYGALLSAWRDAAAGLPDEDRDAIFSQTASRLYRL